MHCINSSVFLSILVNQPWLPDSVKLTLINHFGRMVVNMYVSRGCPKLELDQVKTYVPKVRARSNPWLSVLDRVMQLGDDGHAVKMVRALLHGEKVTRKYWEEEGFEVTGGLWANLADMCFDSLEEGEPSWVRSTGFDEGWEKIEPRKRYDEIPDAKL